MKLCNVMEKIQKSIASRSLVFPFNLVRIKVFVLEQNIPLHLEQDSLDDKCTHIVLKRGSLYVSTLRLINNGEYFKIGRVATLKNERGKQYSTRLMSFAHSVAKEKGGKFILVHGQVQAAPFYVKLGYIVQGEEFIEDGILHYKMVLSLYQ